MKSFLSACITLTATLSFANNGAETQKYLDELPNLLKQSQKIPSRNADGSTSFRNIDSVDNHRKLKVKAGDTVTTKSGKPVQSIQQAMELYNSNDLAGSNQTTSTIKSCLAAIYMIQKDQHARAGVYTPNVENYFQSDGCKDVKISTEFADKTKFKNVAEMGSEIWSIDDAKQMQKIR